jgi:hypothetical protein
VPLQGCQIRMARAALKLSLTEVATASGVNEKTVRRCESSMGRPPVSSDTLLRLKAMFEGNGLRFIAPGDEHPGPGIFLIWNPNSESENPPPDSAK